MKEVEDGFKTTIEFAKLSSKAKTVSSWHKKKIPVELRKQWYRRTVVRAIVDYNDLCDQWLKENVR